MGRLGCWGRLSYTHGHPRRDAGEMPAPLVATRTAAHPGGTRGHIHPPRDLARDEIDLHAIPKVPRMVARGTPIQGRTNVVPARVPSRIARRAVGLSPEEPERVRTHPYPGDAAPDGLLVERIERLEALHEPQFLEIGRASRGGRLRHVGADLACSHDLPIERKLGLLRGSKPLYCGVIGAPGEQDHEAKQSTRPLSKRAVPMHSISFSVGCRRKTVAGQARRCAGKKKSAVEKVFLPLQPARHCSSARTYRGLTPKKSSDSICRNRL